MDEIIAPDFTLQAHNGEMITLSEQIQKSPAMLVFYPGDFTPVCTAQLCDYRDNIDLFDQLNVTIFGISKNSVEQHKKFAEQKQFSFLLLTDPKNRVAKAFGCTSKYLLGMVSRAIVVVNMNGEIIYKYVESIPMTRRKADEIVLQIKDKLSDLS